MGKMNTSYDDFVKRETNIIKIRNPDMDDNAVFKVASKRWKTSTKNPGRCIINIPPIGKIKNNKTPSAYNIFMKREMSIIRRNNPDMRHKDVFKLAASRWKYAPENTKINSM